MNGAEMAWGGRADPRGGIVECRQAAMRENYTLHKLHSLTGIIPTGFYLVQHLTLNSFSLAGPDRFNGVIAFFEGMPKHVLYGLKGLIWACLIYHMVYGFFIVAKKKSNYSNPAMRWRENRYFELQRWTGIIAAVFLVYHMLSTSAVATITQSTGHIQYDQWATKLSEPGGTYLMLAFYVVGLLASTYHFAYGIWNFCIRWGITVSEKSQMTMAKVSGGVFVAVSAIGILALVGFFNPILKKSEKPEEIEVSKPVTPVDPVRYAP
jgi:succinate dehydrogenase / fumarate reductase cytochrome b subunit